MKRNNPIVLFGIMAAGIGFLFSTVIGSFPNIKLHNSEKTNKSNFKK